MFNKIAVNIMASIGTAVVLVLFFTWALVVFALYPVTWLARRLAR